MFFAFVQKLQIARDWAGIPFDISSGYRCPEHNKAIGGVSDSAHMKAIAADIKVKSSRERFLILFGLKEAGFTRFGIGENFIHVDSDTEKAQDVIWLY